MNKKLSFIFSKREYEHKHFWDLVYEWEDCLSKELNAKIILEPKLFDKILKGIPYLYSILSKGKLSLCFQMGSEVMPKHAQWMQKFFRLRAKNSSNIIPCIIDFWETADEVKVINKIYSRNPLVLISSKEAFEFLRQHVCSVNIVHWGLSLPDKYAINENTKFSKKYDVAIMGRQDNLLDSFLQRYIKEHPDMVYAIKKRENGHFNYYTNKGDFIGCADSRDGYFKIMQGAKCGLYATPGITDKDGSNGFNQVTPRFFELLSSGCHIIARYPKNPDTDYYELSKFCQSINDYESFAKRLDFCRYNDVDMSAYSRFLSKHYTSVRAKHLEQIISNIK